LASKDQTIGVLLFLVSIIIAILYVMAVALPSTLSGILPWSASQIQFGAIAIVVLIVFLAVMFIGAWIGWTMATTPPPKPIEDFEAELEKEKAEEKEKEKAD
jgi:predicted DNA-binding transcriptional regulator